MSFTDSNQIPEDLEETLNFESGDDLDDEFDDHKKFSKSFAAVLKYEMFKESKINVLSMLTIIEALRLRHSQD